MKKLISIALAMALSMMLFITANAADSDNLDSALALTAEPAVFSVTVPTTLPVAIDSNGVVTCADNAKVINNSKAPIRIARCTVTPASSWTLSAWDTNFNAVQAGRKEMAMQLFGQGVPTAGTLTLTNEVISGGGEAPLNYDVKLPMQLAAASSLKIADVTFVISWADSI